MHLKIDQILSNKTISRVCESSKDAETLNMSKMVEDAVYTARQMETTREGSRLGCSWIQKLPWNQ